jgi:hypothetical protein
VTQGLKPGEYVVTASYDSRRAAEGIWRGFLEAGPRDFTTHAVAGKSAQADLLCTLSEYAGALGDAAESERLAARATVLDPEDAEPWFRLAEAATANESWDRAIAAYRRLKGFEFARGDLLQRYLDERIAGVERLRDAGPPGR